VPIEEDEECDPIRCAFYIPELRLLIGPEDGYKIAETCRPVNN